MFPLNMRYAPIDFSDKLALLSQHCSPRVVAEMNDYQFKLVKLQGAFVWHRHADTDEVFIVLDGHMTIEFRDGVVALSAGQMHVVPKGVKHRPVAEHECSVLLVEPRGVVNTGDAGGAYTADNDVWI
ncbi:cupin domain-containing protein [Xanthomonas sp. 10-10]|uniref:Cupin domain-containing protein n=1 Tax=Xanthomonas sp. 10-10 TaxID=3115848 RepID=A0AAU7PA96_9XANT